MASLIVHGDLQGGKYQLTRPLYVRPTEDFAARCGHISQYRIVGKAALVQFHSSCSFKEERTMGRAERNQNTSE